MDKDKLNQKIGILGGGQLGKMLCQAGSKLGLNLNILEKDNTFPAFQVTNNFTFGSILSFDDVIKFGENNDIITIEIENVNLEALEELEKKGKKVFPKPNSLKIIKDKCSDSYCL